MSLISKSKSSISVVLPLLLTILSACDNNRSAKENEVLNVTAPLTSPVTQMPSKSTDKIDSVDALLDGLRSRLEAQPDDVEGWILLAKSYQYLGQENESKQAFSRARELGYNGTEIDGSASPGSETKAPPHKKSQPSSSFSREPVYKLMQEVLADEVPQKEH